MIPDKISNIQPTLFQNDFSRVLEISSCTSRKLSLLVIGQLFPELIEKDRGVRPLFQVLGIKQILSGLWSQERAFRLQKHPFITCGGCPVSKIQTQAHLQENADLNHLFDRLLKLNVEFSTLSGAFGDSVLTFER